MISDYDDFNEEEEINELADAAGVDESDAELLYQEGIRAEDI